MLEKLMTNYESTAAVILLKTLRKFVFIVVISLFKPLLPHIRSIRNHPRMEKHKCKSGPAQGKKMKQNN